MPRITARRFAVAALLLALALAGCKERGADTTTEDGSCPGFRARVLRVHDGDTFVLSDQTRVRLIGVDTPELDSKSPSEKRYARLARDEVRGLIDGKDVCLVQERRKKDRYGRTLAHVQLKDETLAARLVRGGFGVVYRPAKYRGKAALLELESAAREAQRGVWGLPAAERGRWKKGSRWE